MSPFENPHFGTSFVKTLHKAPPPQLAPENQSLPEPFVACITGASRGIGKATAQSFAKAGATGLILTARNIESLYDTKELCKTAATCPDLKISLVALDSGNEKQTQALTTVVDQEHGRLDLLLNNAGLVSTHESSFKNFEDLRADQPRITMECNYFGRFLTMQYMLPLLLNSPSGARMVINITSICSHLILSGPLAFNISELASNRLTEIVAQRYADEGLVCFSVHPGLVYTTMPIGAPESLSAMAKAEGDDPFLCGAFCLWLVKEKPKWLSGRYLSSTWDVEELKAKQQEIVDEDKLKSKLLV